MHGWVGGNWSEKPKSKIKKKFKRLGIGELHDIHLKLKDGYVTSRIDLTGDKEPVNIRIDFEIINISSIRITELSIDRAWIEKLALMYLESKKYIIHIKEKWIKDLKKFT